MLSIAWDDVYRDGKCCEIKIEECSKCHKYKLKQTITEQGGVKNGRKNRV